VNRVDDRHFRSFVVVVVGSILFYDSRIELCLVVTDRCSSFLLQVRTRDPAALPRVDQLES